MINLGIRYGNFDVISKFLNPLLTQKSAFKCQMAKHSNSKWSITRFQDVEPEQKPSQIFENLITIRFLGSVTF